MEQQLAVQQQMEQQQMELLQMQLLLTEVPMTEAPMIAAAYGDDGSSNGYFADGTPVGTDDPDYDTNQTRTIYRNSDGYPLVIYPNGDGSWCDDDGNTYTFSTDEDVYDENGGDYYYGGEPAYVRYMPKN